jgi:hypothetical protein
LSFVIDLATSIHISTIRLIEKLSLEGILGRVCYIVVGKVNNMALIETMSLQNLVGMASISLMSVVAEAIRSSDNNCPVV